MSQVSSSETPDSTPEARASRQRPAGMRAFLIIFLALHIPLFVYPVLRLCDWLGVGPLLTVAILLPVAFSQIISRWLLRNAKHQFVRGLRHTADFILGMSPILLMTLLAFEVLVALDLVKEGAAALTVLGVTALVSFTGLVFAVSPVVKRVAFSSANLKLPLRFVQITDVHIGSRSSRFLEDIVERINTVDPDFLCITGDFVDAWGVTAEELSSLQSLSCPIYFSIGNHERYEDLEEIIARLRSLGVQVLRSDAVMHRDDVQVLGIDDRDDALQVERELPRMPVNPDAFKVLMYHRPRGVEAAAGHGIDLMISGHTHNGQIVPFNLIVKSQFEHLVGMMTHGQTRHYVSQGTGTWGPVMRVGTRAEITLFELQPLSH